MSTLSRTELDRSLKTGRVQPLYLLVGCEGYLRDIAARKIADATLSGTLLREFNESTFSLLTDSPMAAIAAKPVVRRIFLITVFSAHLPDNCRR